MSLLRKLKSYLSLVGITLADGFFFARESSCVSSKHQRHERARIMVGCHGIERALSLPQPRKGFGVNDAHRLIDEMDFYVSRYGIDETIRCAAAALMEYRQFNAGVEEFDIQAGNRIDALLQRVGDNTPSIGGIVEVTKNTPWPEQFDFEQFSLSRRSVRHFTSVPVPVELVTRAVALARYAPSACNRQPCRVHVVDDKQLIERLCVLQGGTRGFTECIDKLLLVTSDVSTCTTIFERHQPWVDGGLFAMNLLYALHYVGLGACILNWNASSSKNKQVRRILELFSSENVIVRIAVGQLPDRYQIPVSWRYPVESCMRNH